MLTVIDIDMNIFKKEHFDNTHYTNISTNIAFQLFYFIFYASHGGFSIIFKRNASDRADDDNDVPDSLCLLLLLI